MTQRPDPQNDQSTGVGYAEQAVDAVRALSPADKSWIAAVVIIIVVLQGTEYLTQKASGERLQSYISEIEKNRTEEMRRTQETIRGLTNTMQRITEDQSTTIQRGAAVVGATGAANAGDKAAAEGLKSQGSTGK